MEQSDLLRMLTAEFERRGISYLITGSIASMTYGEPRFTNDIDVVVELVPDHLEILGAAFPAPEFYWSKDAALLAIRQHFQFNILHPSSGLKIDVIVPADSELDRSRFARRQRMSGGIDFDVWMASPEDVILKKMEYYKEGQSDKHIRDIVGVLKVQAEKLDRDYVATWAERLHLSDIWQEILTRLDKP
jgi:hypothetical protein